jgi:hypothetical protein
MKKINYLFALIATVFVLGMTSCDTSNDPQPNPALDGIQLSDLNGTWNNYETTLNGVTEITDNGNACNEFNNNNAHLNVSYSSTSNTVTLNYPCQPDSDVFVNPTINDDDEIVLGFNGKEIFRFEILDTSDLQNNKMDLKLKYSRNSEYIALGTVWHLEK